MKRAESCSVIGCPQVEWAEPSDGGRVSEGGGASSPVQLQRDGTQRQVCHPDAGKHHL